MNYKPNGIFVEHLQVLELSTYYGKPFLVVMQQIQLCKMLYGIQNVTKRSEDYAI